MGFTWILHKKQNGKIASAIELNVNISAENLISQEWPRTVYDKIWHTLYNAQSFYQSFKP